MKESFAKRKISSESENMRGMNNERLGKRKWDKVLEKRRKIKRRIKMKNSKGCNKRKCSMTERK